MPNWDIQLFVPDIDSTEERAILQPLQSKWLTMGGITEKFEEMFAKELHSKFAYAVSGGTAALHLALMALDVGPGHEVLVPSLTFVACANVIVARGATPVFIDICSEEDWTISPEDIRSKLTPKTKGMIVVHYAGFPCHMNEICQIARQHGLFVIEDCAHAVISGYEKNKCGTIGDIGCFSFYSNKNMTTSEGGMVMTQNEELAGKLKILRSHGMTAMPNDRFQGKAYTYDIQAFGLNYRIDDIRSAIGICQFERLPENLKKRNKVYQKYLSILDRDNIQIPFLSRKINESVGFHIFPILAKSEQQRMNMIEQLNLNRIQSSYHYPPIHKFSIYKKYLNGLDVRCPITDDVTSREITLPFYPQLDVEKINRIVSIINRCN